jgi:hypothetical protein
MGGMGDAYRFFVGKSRGKKPFERSRRAWEDGIRKDLRGSRVGSCGLDACGSGYGPVAGSCEHGNDISGSLRGGEFLEYLSDYQLLKDSSSM